jgi:hypothetical protein
MGDAHQEVAGATENSAPKCSKRGQKCHQNPAKSGSTLYLETEEWVSG